MSVSYLSSRTRVERYGEVPETHAHYMTAVRWVVNSGGCVKQGSGSAVRTHEEEGTKGRHEDEKDQVEAQK